MSTCTTAPPAFRKRTWPARNDSSVCYVSMSHSPAAMARRVFLSRSTKWRRDDERHTGDCIRAAELTVDSGRREQYLNLARQWTEAAASLQASTKWTRGVLR